MLLLSFLFEWMTVLSCHSSSNLFEFINGCNFSRFYHLCIHLVCRVVFILLIKLTYLSKKASRHSFLLPCPLLPSLLGYDQRQDMVKSLIDIQ